MENTVVAGRTGALVDIREVAVDKELSREERIAEFVRQIKDPYRFKCGRFPVCMSKHENGSPLFPAFPKLLLRFPGLQIQFLNHIPALPQSAEALIP